MLPQETLKELGKINEDFNDKCDDLFGFKYQTEGFGYECITFGDHVLWDSEDLHEREHETVIECVKRRFNDFLDEINQCRYLDVPPSDRKSNKDIYDAFDEMIEDLHLRGIWQTIDDDNQDEIQTLWFNALKKYIK